MTFTWPLLCFASLCCCCCSCCLSWLVWYPCCAHTKAFSTIFLPELSELLTADRKLLLLSLSLSVWPRGQVGEEQAGRQTGKQVASLQDMSSLAACAPWAPTCLLHCLMPWLPKPVRSCQPCCLAHHRLLHGANLLQSAWAKMGWEGAEAEAKFRRQT